MDSPIMQDAIVSSTVTSVQSPSMKTYIHCNNAAQDTFPSNCTEPVFETRNSRLLDSYASMAYFDSNIYELVGSKDLIVFRRFLRIYCKNIHNDSINSGKIFYKSEKLKKHIRNVILYFHYHWNNHKKEIKDYYFYLQKISDILVVYVNLEMSLFKRESDSVEKISNMLINFLSIYLDNSEEHIFKVLLASDINKKQNKAISWPIYKKYFSAILERQPQITRTEYVRYILAFKLWISMSNTQNEMDEIYSLVAKIINPLVATKTFDTFDFLPQAPKKCINKLQWHLQTNVHDLTNAIHKFLSFERYKNEDTRNLNIFEPEIIYIGLAGQEDCKENQSNRIENQVKSKRKISTSIKSARCIESKVISKNNIEPMIKSKTNLEWLKLFKKSKVSESSLLISRIDPVDSSGHFESLIEATKRSNLSTSDNEVTLLDSSDIETSDFYNCDNYRRKDVLILSDNNCISNNSDITKEENQNSDMFDDLIDYNHPMAIDDNLLNTDEFIDMDDTKSLLVQDAYDTPISYLFDYDMNGLFSSTNDLSYSAIDPCLTKRNSFDLSHSNESHNAEMTRDSLTHFLNDTNYLLTSDLGISDSDDQIQRTLGQVDLERPASDSASERLVSKVDSLISVDDTLDKYSLKKDSKQKKEAITNKTLSPKDKIDLVHDNKEPKEKKRKQIKMKKKASHIEDEKPNSTLKIYHTEPTSTKIKPKSSRKTKTVINNSLLNLEAQNLQKTSSTKSRLSKTKSLRRNQQPLKYFNSTGISTLVEYIRNSASNKIITWFDSGSSCLTLTSLKKLKPRSSQYLIRLMCDKKILLRHYTNNDGQLERLAGISSGKFVSLTERKYISESVHLQDQKIFDEASLLIFFTNNLRSLNKCLHYNNTNLFIILEKSDGIESIHKKGILKKDLIPKGKLKYEVIQAESHDRVCRLIADKLNWNIRRIKDL